jgi:hypothetical protein
MPASIARINRKTALEQAPRLVQLLSLVCWLKRSQDIGAAHIEVIGLPAGRWFEQRSLGLDPIHLRSEYRRNCPRDLILNREDVLQLTVVTLGG